MYTLATAHLGKVENIVYNIDNQARLARFRLYAKMSNYATYF